MGKKKVTLSVDSKIYDDFQKYCEDNAIMLSKKIEIFMKKIVSSKGKNFLLLGFLFMFILNLNLVSAGLSDSGWAYRKNITISEWKIPENLSNFPLLINVFDSDLRNYSKDDGSDIVFALDDNQIISYQIELFNKTYNSTHSLLVAWIKVNLSANSDNVIWMYYNNSIANNQQNSSLVWDDGFKGVYHLKEDSGNVNDSTINSHNSLNIGGTPDYKQTGKIGYAVNFDSTSNENFNFGDVSDFNFADNFTVSAWIKTTQSAASIGVFGKLNNAGLPYRGFALQTNSGKDTFWLNGVQSGGSMTVNDDVWHFLYIIRNNSGGFLYADNTYQASILDTSTTSNTNNFYIAAWGYNMGGGYDYSGLIDEVQLSNVARSIAWMNVSYQNQNNPQGFYLIGNSQEVTTNSISFSNYIENPESNSLYSKNQQYFFNVTVSGSNGTVILEFNQNNYSSLNQGNIFGINISGLSAGNYIYTWWAYSNETIPKLYYSDSRQYALDKADSAVNLTLNNTSSYIVIGKDTIIDLNCTLLSGENLIYLYNNGALINSGYSKIGNRTNFTSTGIYNITCSYLNSQNYSASSETYFVNVGNIANEPVYLNFLYPTPDSGTITTSLGLDFFYEIKASNLTQSIWNWDYFNHTYYSDNLVFLMNFENNSLIGENNNNFMDISRRNNNGNCSGNSCPNYSAYGGRFASLNSNNNNLVFMERFNGDLSNWMINQYGGSVSIINKDYSNKLLLNDTSSASYVSATRNFNETSGQWILEYDLMHNSGSIGVMEFLDSSDNVLASIDVGSISNTISFSTDLEASSTAVFNSGSYKQIVVKIDNIQRKISAYMSEPDGTQGSLVQIGNSKNYTVSRINRIRFRTSTLGTGNVYFDEIRIYKPVLALIGDSITDGKPRWSTHPDYPTGRLSLSSNEISPPNYKIGNFLCSNCWVANRAFGGTTTGGVDSHIQSALLDQGFSQVYISIGHNDIMNGVSLNTMQSNFNSIIDKVLNSGINGSNIIIGNIFPSAYLTDPQKTAERNQWNSWLKTKASELGAVYVDLDAALKDPNNNNSIKPGLSDDGTHLYPLGNDILADAVVSSIYNADSSHGYGAVSFDGIDDSISSKNDPSFAAKELALSIWVKFSNNNINSKIINKKNSFSLGIVNNKLIANLKASGKNSTIISNKTYDDGRWHNIALNYNGSLLSMYIDGKFENSNASSSGAIDLTSDSIFIGSDGSSEFFNGYLDEIRIYNKSLLLSEILFMGNSEFRKINSSYWKFYVNESNLIQKTYYYTSYANNLFGFSNIESIRNVTIIYDIIPPDTIMNLINSYKDTNSMSFSWQNPTDSDFYQNLIYLNNLNVFNTSNNYYNAINLQAGTYYNITIYTMDLTDNINYNGVSLIVKTEDNPPTNPPSGEKGGGGGGGGGGGTYILKNKNLNISQKIAKLEVSRLGGIVARAGEKQSLSIVVKSVGEVFLNKCRLVFSGNINPWFNSKQIEGIAPGEKISYAFDLEVPDNTPSGEYFSELEIKCEETSEKQNISIGIGSGLEIIKIKEINYQDIGLNIIYILENKELLGKDAEVVIWLENEDGKEIRRIRDKFKLEPSSKTERNIIMEIPSGLSGIYYVYFALSSDLGNYVKHTIVLGKPSVTGRVVLGTIGSRVFSYLFLIMFIGVILFFIVKSQLNKKNKFEKTEEPSEVFEYLAVEFEQAKRNNEKDKAKKLYSRINHLYSGMNKEDMEKFEGRIKDLDCDMKMLEEKKEDTDNTEEDDDESLF